MSRILQISGVLYPENSQTNLRFPFSLCKGVRAIRICFSYAPKMLSDAALTDALIDEGFERYILPEDREVLRSLREEVKPLVTLVTLSVDSPTHYVGAAHRHDPVQEHVIGPDESSYGFDPCEMEAGCWSLCLSVHAVVTPECRFELSVEEVEA